MEHKVSQRQAASLTGRAAAPVAVALPVYNGEPYIHVALESLLGQTGVDFEVHIADNCSTDGTEELCRDLAQRDPRVVYHRRSRNVGVTANHNMLVNEVNSPYFTWFAADDAYAPDRLSKLYTALQDRPDAVLAFNTTAHINGSGERIGHWVKPRRTDDPDPSVRLRNLLCIEGRAFYDTAPLMYGLIRRDVLCQTRLLPPIKNSDRVLIAELALHGPFVEIAEDLLLHRKHEEQLSKRTSQSEWYRTEFGRQSIILPNVEEAGWYFRTVARSPLTLADRGRAMLALSPWLRANAVPMARNVAKAALQLARLTPRS
ncbi:glycosyltransferase [Allokutzneria sp. A3M-2-11 16]|uniref:glycosyltransferase family 2 protein n=1 Tax=Allokutzneria sp. A3M-2-11 16 TaxID=2962043 RepID=UPI0020B73BF7|nr:glycosyltransferase family 2 protein [Allokutzneria sp. A3M-2-11 16]MCP3801108.1 glycosyltransferase [Allokutzneria sp. A3M-2-11 16]